MASDQEEAVAELLRRGAIGEDEARNYLQMTHPVKQEQKDIPDTLTGMAKAAGTGVADAATGFMGLPATAEQLMNKVMGVQRPPGTKTQFPTQGEIKDAIGSVTGGSLYKPETLGERYMKSGAEGAASFFNPLNPLKGIGPSLGFVTGLAGEAGEHALPNGRLPAELATLLLSSPLALKSSQTSKAAGKWLKGMGEGEPAEILANQGKVKDTLGVDALLSQGSSRGGVLSDITDLAKTLPEGSKITDLLNAQRTAGVDKVKEMAAAMSKRGLDQPDANSIVAAGTKAYPWIGAAGEKMFTKDMRKSGIGDWDKLTGRLDKASGNDIRSIAMDMQVADPGAFPSLAKKWLTDGYEATLGKEAGRDTPRALNDIPNNLRGPSGSQKADRFNAIIESAADANRLDSKVAKQAANDIMDSLEIVAREQGTSSAAGVIKEGAGSTWFATLLESVGINAPFHAAGRAIERHNYEQVMVKFIDALTSPEGMQKMIQVAQFSPAAHRVKMIGRAAMGLGAMNGEPIESRTHY